MNQQTRAVQPKAKEERRRALLDAADSLLASDPTRLPSVEEVALAAGLAKGTVYLYFPSKERLLLALHERHCGLFFATLIAMLDAPGPVTVRDILAVSTLHLVDPPTFLPLASQCFGLVDQEEADTAGAFKLRIAMWLEAAGAALERRFAALAEGDGLRILMHSYGLIVGLWLALHPSPLRTALQQQATTSLFVLDFRVEIERALVALWDGWLAHGAPPHPLPTST